MLANAAGVAIGPWLAWHYAKPYLVPGVALWELDNLSPRDIVVRAGQAGMERARDVLLRIEYGVYS